MPPWMIAQWFEVRGWDVMRGLYQHDVWCWDGFEADKEYAGIRYSDGEWMVRTCPDGIVELDEAEKVCVGIRRAIEAVHECQRWILENSGLGV